VSQAAALRWGDDAPDDNESARARILNAAEKCFARFGVMKTTVEDIAKVAKVSRATVYRYFDGGRDEIVLGVILRDADRYLTRVRSRIDRQPSLADAIVEFVELTIRAAQRDPSLGRLFNVDEARATGGMIAGGSVALFEKVSTFLTPLFDRWPEQVRPGVEVDDAAEWILRVLLSMLTVDGPRRRSAEAQRQFLERYLATAIARS
jgi:AcrR family transcriptional regulator